MVFALLLAAFAAVASPSDPATHAADRDRTCTADLFDILPTAGGGRKYREKRSGFTAPSSVGKAMLAGCAVAPNGVEFYYEMDPGGPLHDRCLQVFQIRYFPGLGPQAKEAVEALAGQWGPEARPAFGTRRIGTPDHLIEVYHAGGSVNGPRGRYRRTQFGYAKGNDLVLGGEDLMEDPFCTQASQNSQTFLREFAWP
ncbi:hypothetical protein P1X14_01815 [Sphingomonas sp. AOB5]|uniref:hypothetical protein n=1 Tax=Sphingomonas sp. AOB5 TaxID=3034017 RepID=UPI0023F931D1|nr:hypothetical protein [Sphingomonas sp. AOB5]MDF7773969.1 hypothetical protein [Sphingomonas sp. AOB5]